MNCATFVLVTFRYCFYWNTLYTSGAWLDIYQWCLTGYIPVVPDWIYASGTWLDIYQLYLTGYIPVVPDWFFKGMVVCKTLYGRIHLKDPWSRKDKGIVSRLRVSVCHRYVYDSDKISFNQRTNHKTNQHHQEDIYFNEFTGTICQAHTHIHAHTNTQTH